MISEVDFKNRHLILNTPSTPNTITIKAYMNAYGFGRSFIRFFADEQGEVVICQKDYKSYVYIGNEEKIEEATSFLMATATKICTEIKLPQIEHWFTKMGSEYFLANPPCEELVDVDNTIASAHTIISEVFPDAVGPITYSAWYTDLSHRVRHDVSSMYTIPEKCTATVFANDDGIVLISQLATSALHRKQGLANKLLAHICSVQKATGLSLYSANKISDVFYEKNGYEKTGEWYSYVRE